ncbi:hypothetical protein C1645_824607 [Glomus cerebriforme]|uniref:Uncharacterized protein n=1 Tax=Glomus cerebriforme TaxID=658196 RepID=A0A397T0M7_9GLOM|nr:hypothetical protein C1645_824607 [Glomus cerebriforme]
MAESLMKSNKKTIEEFGKNLMVVEVCYYIEFQEYPNTSENGFYSYKENGIICNYVNSVSKELDKDHIFVNFSNPLFKNTFEANKKFYERTTLCTFVKAHKYKCEYINKNGIKCNRMPKLGEITQAAGLINESDAVEECFMV